MSSIVDELLARLPPDRVQTDSDVVVAYGQDRALFETPGRAAVVVSPRSTAEVVLTVEAANAADVPIVPRGAGSGLTGAANAVDDCVIISLHRMDEILEVDTTNRLARVQPGVINADLKAHVADFGLFYPPDPATFELCSMGGNVATNAGGLCCVKYGVTRDYVVGLEVVLASGEVMRTGRRTIKSTTGLDLTGLFVGSEGTLGICTEVTVRLVPPPPQAATAVAYFGDLQDAGAAIVSMFEAGLEPSLLEVLDQAALQLIDDAFSMDLDAGAACLLLIQADGDDSGGDIQRLAVICETSGATEVYMATDPHEGDMLLEARRRAWQAFERLGLAMLPEDVAVPRQSLPELLDGIPRIARRHDTHVPTIGHAGDGNMHPVLIFDATEPDATDRARAAFREIVELALSLGGTLAAEHGVGTLKREFIEDELDPVQLKWQRAVRDALDPHGRFNPGKKL